MRKFLLSTVGFFEALFSQSYGKMNSMGLFAKIEGDFGPEQVSGAHELCLVTKSFKKMFEFVFPKCCHFAYANQRS